MSEPVHIQDLAINRMYGRTFRLHLHDLAPGINIIWGPNGSGKTTVAHAIQTILLRTYQFAGKANVAATLDIAGETLRFSIDGPRRHCTRNGQQIEWNSAPKLIRPDSYHFSLHDLLSAESAGEKFAEAILTEGSGGFDLRSAQNALDFKAKRISVSTATRKYIQAQQDLRQIDQQQKDLLEQKRRSGRLQADLDKSKQAAQEVILLEKAIDWQTQRRAHQDATNAVNSFPVVIRRRTDLSDIVSRASALKETIQGLRQKQGSLSANLTQLRDRRAESPLHPDGLPDRVPELAAKGAAQLRQLDIRCQKLRDDLAGSRKQADNVWIDLGMAPLGPEKLSKDDVQRLYDLISRSLKLKGQKAALEELRSVLDFDPDTDYDHILAQLIQEQQLLAAWIAAQRTPIPLSASAILMVALLGSAAMAIALGLTGSNWALPSMMIPLLIGVALVLLVRKRQDQVLPMNDRALAQRLRAEGAENILTNLLAERSHLTVSREGLNRWRAKATERSRLNEDTNKLHEDLERLTNETGLGIEDQNASHVYALRRLVAWRELTDRVSNLEGQYNQATAEFDHELSKLNNLLTSYGIPVAEDAQTADVNANELRSLNDRWNALSADHLRLQDDVDRVNREFQQAEADYAAIFTELELDAGDMENLRSCALTHQQYLQAQNVLVESSARLEQLQQQLENTPGYHASILERTDLLDAVEEAKAHAKKQERLQQELTTLRVKIQSVEKERSLETALSHLEACRDDLIEAREKDASKAVGLVLAEHLHAHIQEQQLPKVFDRARRIFLDITRGQYELQFNRDGKFCARYTKENRDLNLNQLSSGTRVQLLLSVRMAFVQEQELEFRLPVTLDETLGNSDDERARVVIKTLAHVATERQVFYFTAQGDELAKWHQNCPDIPVNVVPLSEGARSIPVDPDLLPEFFTVPDTDHLDYLEYGRKLRPDRWNGHAEVSDIHLWYLMEDARALRALLVQGVTSWGAAEALYASGLLEVSEEAFAQLRVRANALKAWQNSWKVGRGKPVTSAILEASGAVTDHYMEAVLAKCEDCNYDADELLQALRNGQVKGFKKKKIEDLERYLSDHLYLSAEICKPPEEVYSDVLIAVADELAKHGLKKASIERLLRRVQTGPGVSSRSPSDQ